MAPHEPGRTPRPHEKVERFLRPANRLKEKEETIIVVFPTSWKYPLVGEQGLHEKWNHFGLSSMALPGTELKEWVHSTAAEPLEKILRRVIREELQGYR